MQSGARNRTIVLNDLRLSAGLGSERVLNVLNSNKAGALLSLDPHSIANIKDHAGMYTSKRQNKEEVGQPINLNLMFSSHRGKDTLSDSITDATRPQTAG